MLDTEVKSLIDQFRGRTEQSLRSQFRQPDIPEVMRKFAKENQHFIYNVGPWPWQISAGTTGTFTIPACGEKETVSAPLVIDAVIWETYIVDGGVLANQDWDGAKITQEILGHGPMRGPQESLIPWGCFLAASERPTAQEIAKANKALDAKASQLVSEARIEFQKNPVKAQELIGEKHRWAAGRLNLNAKSEKWLSEYEPKKEAQCYKCFDNINPLATICKTCKHELNGVDGGPPTPKKAA